MDDAAAYDAMRDAVLVRAGELAATGELEPAALIAATGWGTDALSRDRVNEMAARVSVANAGGGTR